MDPIDSHQERALKIGSRGNPPPLHRLFQSHVFSARIGKWAVRKSDMKMIPGIE
ncbi:hypothetical protein BN940_13016 [Castellaniella defragrans 65Phen]|uniref:Uncharacterized protein n=2 Tax=Castellaniella defragrans TaxID=75697 RepID=W8WZ57_CASD6|nr:hypothetical protein BN940_13016 [Castellaniella defragrans 65Phen]